MTTPVELNLWTDVLGNDIRAGDTVAYASINGKSPQLVIANVERIMATDSNGVPLQMYDYREGKTVPSCSIVVHPVLDARGFWRSERGRAVHLKIPQNVIRVDATVKPPNERRKDETLQILEDLAGT